MTAAESISERRISQRDDLRRLIRDVMRDQQSLRKNGDSMGDWVKYKFLTPERVMLAILMVFTFGGRVQRFEIDLSAYQERTRAIESQHQHINQELSQMAAFIKDVRVLVDLQTKLGVAQAEEMKNQAGRLDTLTAQQRNAITPQQLLPRLERIEQQLKIIEANQ